MPDKNDHLIERAAALLRGSAPAPDTRPPDLPRGDGARPGRGSPSRDLSVATRADPRPNRVATTRSVAELRPLSAQTPVTLAELERAGLMVARMSRTKTSEEYRIVIGRVLRALHEVQDNDIPLGPDASPNVIMVTSARPGEGKSFTSLNLGGSIAQNAGESVLVVDVDAKNNSLSDMLGLSDRKGFLDLVADPNLSPDELIVPSHLPNLSFLALGSRSVVRDASEDSGLEERRLTPPIKRLAERFPRTLILLDAPPCLSTSDPHTLSPSVGQVVLVVEAERTQRSEVEAAIDMVKVCPTITMLLNKVRMRSGHTFGTYDYFGSYT